MPARTHEYEAGAQHGCWTVVREVDPERKSWGLQRMVLARCQCGFEETILPKMLHRNSAYCRRCNPGRTREKFYNPGDVYGPWTVVREVERRQYPSGCWARQIVVQCRCGNEVVVAPSQLRKSKQCQRCARTVDIAVGQRIGKLVVVEVEILGRRSRTALVRCDCGETLEIAPALLVSGNHLSCGCLKRRKGEFNPRWRGCGQLSGQKWKCYRIGAKNRDISFDISIKQAWAVFVGQGGTCALSGLPIDFGRGSETTASLDRIDSTKGYTIDNVQWVHKDINALKMDLPEDRLLELCLAVAEHAKLKSHNPTL